MDAIDRAIAYIATFDPQFPDAIRGDSPAAIAELDDAAQRSTSPDHRAFLERMGQSMSWIDLGDLNCSAAALTIAHRGTRGQLPPGLELFGVSAEDPYQDMFLQSTGGADARVVLIYSLRGGSYEDADPDDSEPVAGSLAEMLCMRAIVKYRLQDAPHMVDFVQRTGDDRGIASFADLMRGLRLEPLWFSTSMCQVVEYNESVILARQYPDPPQGPIAITIGSTSRAELDLLSRYLVYELGLERAATRR